MCESPLGTGIYKPFDECTRLALRHAVAEQGLVDQLGDEAEQALMQAYNSLRTFPDVASGLQLIKEHGLRAYVFSNGTADMVNASVATSPDLDGGFFQGIITVDTVGAFKPDRRVYQHLVETVNKNGHEEDDVWLVSGNPFDIVGARAAGWQAAWVDRAGKGWVDCLGEAVGVRPSAVVTGVDEAVHAVMKSNRQMKSESKAHEA